LSDQTEKPKGALPKGYDANTTSTENTPSTEVVKQKKINFLELVRYTPTDQDQREKDLKEYEQKYLSRYKQPKAKPIKSSNLKSGVDIGKLTLRQYVNTKRKAKQKEIKNTKNSFFLDTNNQNQCQRNHLI